LAAAEARPLENGCVTEFTLRGRVCGNAKQMRKLILLLVAMLTTAAPASAAVGPMLPHPVATAADDPAPDAEPSSDQQETRQRAARRFERAEMREDLRRAEAARQSAAADVSPQLQAIAQCESGGDPAAVGGGGQFRGKYQFTYATWAAVGGRGDPAAAPEAEQDRRAAVLYARSGPGQWPVCGG
jgi:Transglycosylase-like domain